MRTRVAVAVVAVIVSVLVARAAYAQDTRYGDWTYRVNRDDFSGRTTRLAFVTGDEVMLFVGCLQDTYYTLTIVLLDGIFRDGNIATRWDGGEIERFRLTDNDESLSANAWYNASDYHPLVFGLIARLLAHSELRVRFERWPDTQVTDRLSLRGSTRAIRALGCGP